MLTRDSLAERLAYRHNYNVKACRILIDEMLASWRDIFLSGAAVHIPGVLLLKPEIVEERPLGGVLRGKTSPRHRRLKLSISGRLQPRLKARAKELLR